MESEPQKGAFSLALVALLLTLTTAQQRMYTTHLHLFQVPTKAHIFMLIQEEPQILEAFTLTWLLSQSLI